MTLLVIGRDAALKPDVRARLTGCQSIAAHPSRLALVGNINDPKTLYAQGPPEVREEVFRALEAGVPLIGPECAIPLRTPIQNLKEIPRAVRDWHREHTASN